MKKRLKKLQDNGPDEQGAIFKKGKNLIKAALVYANTYRAGMSSLGFQTVYRLANQIDHVVCERVFMPDPRQKNRQIKSIESGLSLDKFDIILFSISFENDFLNLAQLLQETGIPLRSSHRNHFHPLVVAGGVACFLNPEPIAPFVDLFLLGEAECLLDKFFETYRAKDHAKDKTKLLSTVEKKIAGAYVPALHPPLLYSNHPFRAKSFGKRIKVQLLDSLDQVKTNTCILTSNTAFKDTFLVETLKGCPHGCRFCTAGFIYRPPRIYPVENICRAMDDAKGKTDRIGLVSSAILDHPDIDKICKYGRDNGFKLSFSSLRADRLDDKIIDILAHSGVKTATLAPEAGSDRMRHIINKKIDEKTIIDAAKRLVEKKILNLKLYFMIGLPFETDKDVEAIVILTQKIKAVFLEAARKQKRIGTITLSINPFIPKPCTPFQWSGMVTEPILRRRTEIIRQGLKKTANITLNFESLKKAKINALLSLGDRNTADIIEAAVQYGWTRAMKMNQTHCDRVIYQEKPVPDPDNLEESFFLPWDILDHRVSDAFLAKELIRAKNEKQSASCPRKECIDCRICINPD